MIEGHSPLSAASDASSLWLSCVDRLAQEIPEQQFNTWIRPLSATVAPDGYNHFFYARMAKMAVSETKT